MSSEGAGVGSVWNANSWHWEEKNYSGWSEKYLRKRLADFGIKAAGDAELRLSEPQIKGESSVSVRKGKRITVCEYRIKCVWEARRGEERLAGGMLDIPEFNGQDDEYSITVKADGDDDIHARFSAVMRHEGVPALRQALSTYLHDLMEVDREAMSVEEDKKRREEEQSRAEEAEQLKGDEKQQIAQQVRAQEDKRKLETPNQPKTLPEGQGSLWNPNSYHWEEKPQTQWSLDELRARLESAALRVLGGQGVWTFFNVNVTGEASTTIRKGNKIIIFDFRVSSDWTATTRDEQGKFMADARGQVDIPEFSSEDIDDFEVDCFNIYFISIYYI
eukprot:GHVS01007115.1.p1 GENE.GHVS01007115.1~~GHVS01007115.1.p1  ORF type:complete len:332 (+),score=66.39 GHVS01007115.1:65-1060(+)